MPVAEPNSAIPQPVPVASTTPAAAMPAATDGKKKILIIEDERPLAHALELKLSHGGFSVISANSGSAAISAIAQTKFDLILLDLILPEIDGFELIQKIRETDTAVRIVILSNLGQPEDKERVAKFNVTAYYVKSNMPLASVVESVQSITNS